MTSQTPLTITTNPTFSWKPINPPPAHIYNITITIQHNGTIPEQWENSTSCASSFILQTPDGYEVDAFTSEKTPIYIAYEDMSKTITENTIWLRLIHYLHAIYTHLPRIDRELTHAFASVFRSAGKVRQYISQTCKDQLLSYLNSQVIFIINIIKLARMLLGISLLLLYVTYIVTEAIWFQTFTVLDVIEDWVYRVIKFIIYGSCINTWCPQDHYIRPFSYYTVNGIAVLALEIFLLSKPTIHQRLPGKFPRLGRRIVHLLHAMPFMGGLVRRHAEDVCETRGCKRHTHGTRPLLPQGFIYAWSRGELHILNRDEIMFEHFGYSSLAILFAFLSTAAYTCYDSTSRKSWKGMLPVTSAIVSRALLRKFLYRPIAFVVSLIQDILGVASPLLHHLFFHHFRYTAAILLLPGLFFHLEFYDGVFIVGWLLLVHSLTIHVLSLFELVLRRNRGDATDDTPPADGPDHPDDPPPPPGHASRGHDVDDVTPEGQIVDDNIDPENPPLPPGDDGRQHDDDDGPLDDEEADEANAPAGPPLPLVDNDEQRYEAEEDLGAENRHDENDLDRPQLPPATIDDQQSHDGEPLADKGGEADDL